jgi:hypothetical protein
MEPLDCITNNVHLIIFLSFKKLISFVVFLSNLIYLTRLAFLRTGRDEQAREKVAEKDMTYLNFSTGLLLYLTLFILTEPAKSPTKKLRGIK